MQDIILLCGDDTFIGAYISYANMHRSFYRYGQQRMKNQARHGGLPIATLPCI